MNEDLANEISSTPPADPAEPCCGCHGRTFGCRLLTALLIFCGIVGIGVGVACLIWLANPDIGIGPFTRIEGGGLVESFLFIRRMAFLTIVMGTMTTLIGAVRWRRDARMECGT